MVDAGRRGIGPRMLPPGDAIAGTPPVPLDATQPQRGGPVGLTELRARILQRSRSNDLSYRDVEELLAERGIDVDTSPSTGGYSGSPRCSWSQPGRAETPRGTAGSSMRHTSRSMAGGDPSTGWSTSPARSSTCSCLNTRTGRRPADSFTPGAEGGTTPGGHDHRPGRRLPASTG